MRMPILTRSGSSRRASIRGIYRPAGVQKRIDRTLALIASRDYFGPLSRYETSLLNGLNRTVALLSSLQTSRIQAANSTSVHSERLLMNIPLSNRARPR